MIEPSHAHDVVAPALLALVEDARAGRERVLAVSHSPQSDGSARDDEALHDFRVALRRLRTLLRVARKLYGKRRLMRIEGELKYYAQQTGSLRDEEALRDTLSALSLPEAARAEVGAWLVRRARAARSQKKRIDALLRDGPKAFVPAYEGGKPVRPLDRSFDKLAHLLRSERGRHLTTEELGHDALARAKRDVAEHAHGDARDATAMHELRIREKRLRYTAELFAAPLGGKTQRLAKHATRMQRRLGDLHDLDEAIAKVARGRGLDDVTRRVVGAALATAREASERKLVVHLDKERAITLEVPEDDVAEKPAGSDTSPEMPTP